MVSKYCTRSKKKINTYYTGQKEFSLNMLFEIATILNVKPFDLFPQIIVYSAWSKMS